MSSLAEKVKLSSSTVKALHAATEQPSPGSTIHDQLHSETSNLESLPTPSDDDLLSNLDWMHHPADEVHPQINVIGASSKPTIAENSEDSDFSSILRNYEDIFDETVPPAMSGLRLIF